MSVTGPRPNFIVVFPLKPRPTKAKGRGKLAQVKNSKPAQLLRAAYSVPINFALGAGCGIFGGPKEGPLNLVDELYGAQRDIKCSEVVDVWEAMKFGWGRDLSHVPQAWRPLPPHSTPTPWRRQQRTTAGGSIPA
jgi:hypothetical protein